MPQHPAGPVLLRACAPPAPSSSPPSLPHAHATRRNARRSHTRRKAASRSFTDTHTRSLSRPSPRLPSLSPLRTCLQGHYAVLARAAAIGGPARAAGRSPTSAAHPQPPAAHTEREQRRAEVRTRGERRGSTPRQPPRRAGVTAARRVLARRCHGCHCLAAWISRRPGVLGAGAGSALTEEGTQCGKTTQKRSPLFRPPGRAAPCHPCLPSCTAGSAMIATVANPPSQPAATGPDLQVGPAARVVPLRRCAPSAQARQSRAAAARDGARGMPLPLHGRHACWLAG